MKSKRVLLGLFLGLFALLSSVSFAQKATGNMLFEVGPDNIGGRVTSLVVDKSDPTHQTIYAGSATGGLYVRSNDRSRAQFADIWNYVPFIENGVERVLSISDMVQGPEDLIFIGCGEGSENIASRFGGMNGRGHFFVIFNPKTGEFLTPEPSALPNDLKKKEVRQNRLAVSVSGDSLYVFVATPNGLARLVVKNENIMSADTWKKAKLSTICEGEEIFDVAVAERHNMVYFTGEKKFYKISSLSSKNAVDITGTNSAFTSASRIRLAINPEHQEYLYAMTFNKSGSFSGVFLSHNNNAWTRLNTETMAPFTYNSGFNCGAMTPDIQNQDRLILGGSDVWTGEGFVRGSYYQWIKASFNEKDLGTNFMSGIYSSSYYVHSGVTAIVQTMQEIDGEQTKVTYIASNGGVFVSNDDCESFANINRGLNNVQINGVDICTDGTIIAGANHNGCIIVDSRCNHHQVTGKASWYDSVASDFNHTGSVVWQGNGGQVASSMFQQYAPLQRRNTFFSADNGKFARAYADFFDYNNTQTWTINTNFLRTEINAGHNVAQMYLWENTNEDRIPEHVAYTISVKDSIYTKKKGHILLGTQSDQNGAYVDKGDTILIPSVGHASYPFRHVFTERLHFGSGSEALRIEVQNPFRSHLFLLDRHVAYGNTNVDNSQISMSWTPTDFRKVYYDGSDEGSEMLWVPNVYAVDMIRNPTQSITSFAVSNDGDVLLAVVTDSKTQKSMIVRISGIINNVDYTASYSDICGQLGFGTGKRSNNASTVEGDTLRYEGDVWFPRPISAIVMDRREGKDRALVLFESDIVRDSNNVMLPNVLELQNPTANYTFADRSVKIEGENHPVYSGLIEYTTGDVFVGTDRGVYATSNAKFASKNWSVYGNFNGVPVTAMAQQIHALPVLHFTNNTTAIPEHYTFQRTKRPYAIAFGTYGRGIFMDTTYVVDHTNEVVDYDDYKVGITPVVAGASLNSVKVFPNPVSVRASLELSVVEPGNALVRVYDLAGRVVYSHNLGTLQEGTYTETFSCKDFKSGMYLVNVSVAGKVACAKMMVR